MSAPGICHLWQPIGGGAAAEPPQPDANNHDRCNQYEENEVPVIDFRGADRSNVASYRGGQRAQGPERLRAADGGRGIA